MNHDINAVLKSWPYRASALQVRTVETGGREVIQVRVDLGILQLETSGRPDGTRPFGFPSFFDYLRDRAKRAGDDFVLSDDECSEADREFIQYYHRRVSWMVLRRFRRAIADADHTLEFMDFVREHSPSEDYTRAHEQYRGFVLFHRTQAEAAVAVEGDRAEDAVDAIRTGMSRIRSLVDEDDEPAEDGMVQVLQKMEESLRQMHNIGETMQEKLERAVENEEYEAAAQLRDAIRRRQ